MKYGFIGCGNMGYALAKALACRTMDILICDPILGAERANTLGCQEGTVQEVAENCDRIFIAVKPNMVREALLPVQAVLADKKPLLISMAAGLEIATVEKYAGTTLPIIRIMPNNPVSVGKGMIGYTPNGLVSEDALRSFLFDMKNAGLWEQVEEELMDTVSALSGSGPAYMYMFAEALADGAVACGVPRKQAMEYAAVTMLGAAEMLLQSGQHPGALKDAVCSPGGSTIAGVKALEDGNFRATVMNCIQAATKRNAELGK